MVLAINLGCSELIPLQRVGFRWSPCKISWGSWSLLQANGELIYTIRHEQGLLRVAKGEVGPDPNDGRELGSVKNRNAMSNDLPESLFFCFQGTDRHRVVSQHGAARAR